MFGLRIVYAQGHLKTSIDEAIFGSLNGCPFAQNEAFPDPAGTATPGSEERLSPKTQAPRSRPRLM